MKDFRKLKVWEKGHRLTLEIYRITKQFPQEEMYGLKSQTRRSCASIPTNIAEGCGRDSDAELARFLHIAMGSASELQYLLLLSEDLDLIDQSDYETSTRDVVEIKQMLASFMKILKPTR